MNTDEKDVLEDLVLPLPAGFPPGRLSITQT